MTSSRGWTPPDDELTPTSWYIRDMGRSFPIYRWPGHVTVVFFATPIVKVRGGTFDQLPTRRHFLRVPLPHLITVLETSILQFLTREFGVSQEFARDITAAVLPFRAQGRPEDFVMKEELSVGVDLVLSLEKLDAVSKWLRAGTFGVAAGLEGERTCCICLDDLRPGDQLRGLPCCTHVFHGHCVVPWVQRGSRTCPYCRRIAFNSSEKKAA